MLSIRWNDRRKSRRNQIGSTEIKRFINEYNWEGINDPSVKDD